MTIVGLVLVVLGMVLAGGITGCVARCWRYSGNYCQHFGKQRDYQNLGLHAVASDILWHTGSSTQRTKCCQKLAVTVGRLGCLASLQNGVKHYALFLGEVTIGFACVQLFGVVS